MNDVDMLKQTKCCCGLRFTTRNALLSVTTVLDSMKDDFAVMQKEMERMKAITNSWSTLLRGSKL